VSKGRAFFSTMPGIISALAGLVTVIVGVLAIAAQLGWFSGDDDDNKDGGNGRPPTTVSTLAGESGGSGGAGGPSTTAVTGRLSASRTSLKFDVLGAKELTVTVSNEASGPVTLKPPQITGTDSAQFAASYAGCPTPLGAGVSCEVRVTFKPTKAGKSTAKLVVTATAAGVRAAEVEIEGNHVL